LIISPLASLAVPILLRPLFGTVRFLETGDEGMINVSYGYLPGPIAGTLLEAVVGSRFKGAINCDRSWVVWR
jgi:hypothetical protein